MKRFAWISAVTTALTFPLIALGAIVRLHGAGLACPDWPLCYGRITPLNEVVSPPPEGFRIALEVGHRYLAGFVGLLVLGLAIAAWTKFRHHHSLRWLSLAVVGLLIPQAILGGLTVLMKLAPITVSLHLISGNLFFGSLILLTVQSFRIARQETQASNRRREHGANHVFRRLVIVTLVIAGLQIWLGGWVSSSGASMACPEFPTCHGSWAIPTSYGEFLQMSHRLMGFVLAAAIAAVSIAALQRKNLTVGLRILAGSLSLMVVGQILLGWFNVANYIPVPTSAMHTALAAAIFGTLIYIAGRISLPHPIGAEPMSSNASDQTTGADSERRVATMLSDVWQTIVDYRELTKPRIVHLLVLTTFCTMLVAASGLPELRLVIWTLVGTTLICGSAQVINMVWDRDIDEVMERTSDRPIVQGRVEPTHALIFSGVIGFAGMMVLNYFANPLAALMGIAGHIYYSVIYTMWLKRSTPQNIVIGGGAGAFPTLIGWTAVTGSLSATAFLIFAVVFFWTPPHFWALALYKDTEYEKAGVPMMPVSRGERTTKLQMLIYTALLVGVSALLALVGLMGIIYLVSAIVLGAVFAYCNIKTAFNEGDRWPKRTFAFSIIYLGLLFGAMSVDSLSTKHFTEERRLTSIERQAERIRETRSLDELRQRNGQTLPGPKITAESEGVPNTGEADE